MTYHQERVQVLANREAGRMEFSSVIARNRILVRTVDHEYSDRLLVLLSLDEVPVDRFYAQRLRSAQDDESVHLRVGPRLGSSARPQACFGLSPAPSQVLVLVLVSHGAQRHIDVSIANFSRLMGTKLRQNT
jgi:hypothetical protein